MKLNYPYFYEAIFLKRLNRFKCLIDINNSIYSAHIHDPGRLNELLKPGVKVLIRPHLNIGKTDYYLFAVDSIDGWVLVDSALHNKFFSWLIESNLIPVFSGFRIVDREFKFMNGKFDFLLKSQLNTNIILEVKGCTLVLNNVALFPDAPTLRGRKHIKGLIEALNLGYNSIIFFLVTHPGARVFKPNWQIDSVFSELLLKAYEIGVEIYVGKVGLDIDDMKLNWHGFIPVIFK